MTKNTKSRTISGVIWSTIERFSVQGVQFVLTIIISRLILPSDYGLIAMLGFFLAIAQTFIDSGFSNALIQKQDRTEIDFSTVFYFNIVVGIIVYIILYVCSQYIASFYNEPKLHLITKFIGLNLIISSFSVIHNTILTINLNFKVQAIASLIAVIISGVIGVIIAYMGFGIWAIIIQSLLNNLLNTLLLWILVKWRPKLYYSWTSFQILFGFGSKLLLGALLHTIYINLYTLCIGKIFSATELGYYNQAFKISQFPSSNISSIIARVTYPIECEIQHDNKLLQNNFLKFIRLSAFIIFPLMIGLCVLAKPIIQFLLTDKWLGSVTLLQIMCLAYMWNPIMKMNWDLLNVKHRSDYSLKSEIIKKFAAIIILIISIPMGIKYMCVGLIIYSLADICIVTYFTKKILPDISLKKEIKVLFPILILSISMGGIIYFTISYFNHVLLKIIIGIILGPFFYISSAHFFKFEEIEYMYKLIKVKKQF